MQEPHGAVLEDIVDWSGSLNLAFQHFTRVDAADTVLGGGVNVAGAIVLA